MLPLYTVKNAFLGKFGVELAPFSTFCDFGFAGRFVFRGWLRCNRIAGDRISRFNNSGKDEYNVIENNIATALSRKSATNCSGP